MPDFALRAQRRAVLGKKVRFIRRQGLLPASLYGPGVPSVALQLTARDAEHVLRRATATTLLPLQVDGDPPRRVLVREVQRHPVSERALHVDLYAVPLDVTTRAEVPLHFVGDAPAITQLDGTLIRNLESVEVEALPDNLPARLEVDLTALVDLHAVIHVSDLTFPSGVTVHTSPDTLVASVVPPRLEAAPVTAPEPSAEAPASPADQAPA